MVDRRRFMVGAGSILLGSGAIYRSGAFSKVAADRGVSVDTASGSDALLGIVGQGPVKKNSREPMVEFTNNLNESLDITVSLDSCSDGTLHNNEGNSACTVTLTLNAGKTQRVDLTGSTSGTVTYSVSATSSGFQLDTAGSVEVVSGRVKGTIRIQKPVKDKAFTAAPQNDEFNVEKVDIRDDDGDSDLQNVEFKVIEGGSGGSVVASRTEVFNPTVSDYTDNNGITIIPNSGSGVRPNTTYRLEITAEDADGNTSSETVEDST